MGADECHCGGAAGSRRSRTPPPGRVGNWGTAGMAGSAAPRVIKQLRKLELRHAPPLIAVADHIAGCNAGLPAAQVLSRGAPGVVFGEANP
jgi:hypothetical protein